MNSKRNTSKSTAVGATLALLLSASLSGSLQGATTTIAQVPLVTTSSGTVLPNIFFMIDDSGSMDSTYMPDPANNFSGRYGYTSAQCNGVFYDPAITYSPPVTATGTNYPNASFTGAWNDGYNTGNGTTNLSTSFSVDSTTAQAAFYYRYSGTQSTQKQKDYFNTSSTFYKECRSTIDIAANATASNPGPGVFTKVTISATSGPGLTDERTNFANWWSYYRKRILMMKTASGISFSNIDDKYRVGFATLNNNKGNSALNVDTFKPAQKANFYTKLYEVTVGNSTPLREALSTVGKYYANKLSTINGLTVTDPIQYSCQQNFTILATDGYWNGSTPTQLDGTTDIGNQDDAAARPYNDGAIGASDVRTTKTVTSYDTTVTTTQNALYTKQVRTGTSKKTTTPWSRTNTIVSGANSCVIGQPTSCPLLPSASASANRYFCAYSGSGFSGTSNCTSSQSGAYGCRTTGSNTPSSTGGSACITGSDGNQHCVYANNSTAGTSSCVGIDSNSAYLCVVTPNGYTVTVQPQTYSQVKLEINATTGTDTPISTVTSTPVTTTTTTTQTVVTTNLLLTSDTTTTSTSSPTTGTTTTTTTNGSSTAVAPGTYTNDTLAPTSSTTWTNSGTATSSCVTSPPAGGATPAVNGTDVIVNSSGTVTSYDPPSPAPVGPPTTTSISTTPVVTTTSNLVSTSGTGGVSNTLADVAQYYYVTDLRTSALGNGTGALGTDVTTNNVPVSGIDSAQWQHLTTFTLGLGARGRMIFSPTYLNDSSGDFFSVKNGLNANSSTGVCSWQSNGTTCNWPTPAADRPETIDDLWHAAVNGRGNYFAATNPTTVGAAISNALASISTRTGASAAATTSNPNIVAGDNYVFSTTFTTNEWDGELVRNQLDIATGAISNVADWSAQAQLDARVVGAYSSSARTIYTRDFTSTTTGVKSFEWTNLTAAEQLYFTAPNVSSSNLSQFCLVGSTCLSATSKAAAVGDNLVRFLRGDRTNEGDVSDISKYYRLRAHVLGDIVNAESVYVKTSLFTYSDPGYSSFVTQTKIRKGYVYVAANDGMLHAFDATTGAEAWAYIPSFVLPNLYKLADKVYQSKHQYFLDSTPVISDVYSTVDLKWHTILVAGQGGGGQGYFALDITGDPSTGIVTPKLLWEFTDANLGYTFGNPVVTKLKAVGSAPGQWVVMFTTGYNNTDGVGRLYIVDANTGVQLSQSRISTGVGSSGTPSGLSKINAWVDNVAVDNTTLRVYGGDLLGNVWRFDVNGDIGNPGYDAQALITLVDSVGTPQPITTKPELGLVNSKAAVFIGTGQFLGTPDLTTTQKQSIYGIKDALNTTTLGNPRDTATNFVKQVEVNTICPVGAPASVCSVGQNVRTSTSNTVDFAVNNGWYVDLVDSRERANTDSSLQLGLLALNTNIPSSDACAIGGYSNRYFLDYKTGGAVASASRVVSSSLGNALATRPVLVRLPNGVIGEITQLSDGKKRFDQLPPPPSSSIPRRVNWRELTN